LQKGYSAVTRSLWIETTVIPKVELEVLMGQRVCSSYDSGKIILSSKLMEILGILLCGNIIGADRSHSSRNPSTENPKPKVG